MNTASNHVKPTVSEEEYLNTLRDMIDSFSTGVGPIVIPAQAIVGIKEIASFFNLRPSTIANWAFRAFDNGFPDPVVRLGATPIYDLREIVSWYVHWHPRIGKKVGMLPDLSEYFGF